MKFWKSSTVQLSVEPISTNRNDLDESTFNWIQIYPLRLKKLSILYFLDKDTFGIIQTIIVTLLNQSIYAFVFLNRKHMY